MLRYEKLLEDIEVLDSLISEPDMDKVKVSVSIIYIDVLIDK